MTNGAGMADFDGLLASWLETVGPEDVRAEIVDRSLAEARNRRQHRGLTSTFGEAAWPRGRGWIIPRVGSRRSLRPLVIVLLLLLVAAVAGAMVAGGFFRSPPQDPPTGEAGTLAYALDGDIFVVDLDDPTPVRIADGQSDAGFWFVSWSPDGRLTYSDGETVHFADIQGTQDLAIPDAGCCPTWSPDGSMVASALHKPGASRGSGPDRADQYPDALEVVVLGSNGAVQTRLTLPGPINFLGSGTHLYWTPDGRAITVQGAQWDGPNRGRGVLVPVDGSDWIQLPVAPAYGATSFFSPDGKRVVGDLVAAQEERAPVVAASDGSGVRPFVSDDRVPAGGSWYGALWSPDGTRVAATYSTFTGSAGAETLYVLDLRTDDVKILWTNETTDTVGSKIYPKSWDAVTDRLLFTAAEGLVSIGADGSDPRILAANGYNAAEFQPRVR